MLGRLSGRVALVTGASGGLGKATAQLFGEEGAKVCVNYHKSASEAERVAEYIKDAGGDAFAFGADITKENEVVAMVERIVAEFGRIDILVNNSGVFRPADTFSLKVSDLDDMFAINVRGVIYCTREAAKYMIPNRYGRIVNIASIAGVGTATAETTAYAPTKAAVIILTKRFALEFGPYGITVNSIAPGFIRTPINEAGTTPEEYAKTMESIGRKTMLNRIGQPIEIASAALFFASDESKFVTAQMLTVDGGRKDNLTHSL